MTPDTFFADFGCLAAAPNGIQKLRELILTLAMHGKLVPQDPTEQPAVKLLEEVEVEKQRLVKEGKIKKPKPLPEIKPEDLPYPLPIGWEWVRFGTIAQHNSGKTLDRSRNTGQPRNYITTSNLYWGRFKLEDLRQMPIRDEELEKCTAKRNDLLICEGGEAGRAAVWRFDAEICFQNHLHRARFYNGIDPYFAFRFLEKLNATGEINQHRKGVGISNMSSKALGLIVLPLPPLQEQKRIVAKVEQLMVLCNELEEKQTMQREVRTNLNNAALDALLNAQDADELAEHWQRICDNFPLLYDQPETIGKLRSSILNLAVQGKLVPQDPINESASNLLLAVDKKRMQMIKEGRVKRFKQLEKIDDSELPFGAPAGWAFERMGYLFQFIDYRGKTPKKVKAGIRLITAKNIRMGYLKDDPREFVSKETYTEWMTRGIPQKGDLLFTTEAPMGNICLANLDEPFALAQRVINLHPYGEQNSNFLMIAIMSPIVQQIISTLATGMTATGIKAAKLKLVPLPIPPAEEQSRIVAKVDQLMFLCDQLQQQLDRAQFTSAKYAEAVVAALGVA